ncbi:MAG: peptide-methionine (S)-S-oxide reductase MsrA [Methylophilaceae bacterium]
MDILKNEIQSLPINAWLKAFHALTLIGLGMLLSHGTAFSAEEAVVIPPPTIDVQASGAHLETMVVAGGCFWGVQGVFQHVRGVTNAVSGYSGGKRETAAYKLVSEGDTGHAESVQITYDPTKVTYGQLLQVFFSVAHNPTQLNRQGPDSGTQYRSAVFPINESQRNIVQAYLKQLNQAKAFRAATATTVETYNAFYPAEGYHQNFLTLNPYHPYIVANDLPKIGQLKRIFPNLYQDKPVLVGSAAK